MRVAAEKGIEGMTENQRRGRYAHAAALALAYVQADHSPRSTTCLSAPVGSDVFLQLHSAPFTQPSLRAHPQDPDAYLLSP